MITRAATETATPLGVAPDDVAAAAEVLAVLHDANIPTTHVHRVGDELQIACRWVRVLRLLGGEHHLRLRELVVGLAESAKAIHEPGATVIHRDFHPAQVLRSNGRLWLTDLDTLCRGHAELDLV